MSTTPTHPHRTHPARTRRRAPRAAGATRAEPPASGVRRPPRTRSRQRRGRDPAAWDRLFHLYRHRLAGVARRTLRKYQARWAPDEVEDVVQEVWCRLVQHWGPRRLGLEGAREGRLFTYLARTTRNVVVDWLRATTAQKRGGDWTREGGGVRAARGMLDPGPSPEEVCLARELRRRFLVRCAALLPPPRRCDLPVLERALLDGWSSREISRSLGGRLSASAVDSLVYRMRRRLSAEGGWEGDGAATVSSP